MKFHCLVSKSKSRKPMPIEVEAEDEAEAAFKCWLDGGWTGHPTVYQKSRGNVWVASDGHCTANVQILGISK